MQPIARLKLPEISVVVPTRNRARSLRRTLTALGAQTYAPDRFEVVVAANACADDTGAMVRALRPPYVLRLVEVADVGIGPARNAGAAGARGQVLIFLDDDVEPLPDFLAAHAHAHRSRMDLVAVGPLLTPPLPRARGLLAERLHSLDEAFAVLLAGAQKPLDWGCMTGGNVSLTPDLFRAAGGFDASIVGYGSEDYELALRAAKVGARFEFLPDAAGYHHRQDGDSLAGYLRRARSIGRNDAALAQRHPEMIDHLALGLVDRPQTALGRSARTLSFDYPMVGDAIARGLLLVGWGWMLATVRWRRRWNRLVDGLHQYWYFRGVADVVGGAAVHAYLVGLRQARDGGRAGGGAVSGG